MLNVPYRSVSPDAVAPHHVHAVTRGVLWLSNRDKKKQKKKNSEKEGEEGRARIDTEKKTRGREVQTWPSQGNQVKRIYKNRKAPTGRPLKDSHQRNRILANQKQIQENTRLTTADHPGDGNRPSSDKDDS